MINCCCWFISPGKLSSILFWFGWVWLCKWHLCWVLYCFSNKTSVLGKHSGPGLWRVPPIRASMVVATTVWAQHWKKLSVSRQLGCLPHSPFTAFLPVAAQSLMATTSSSLATAVKKGRSWSNHGHKNWCSPATSPPTSSPVLSRTIAAISSLPPEICKSKA